MVVEDLFGREILDSRGNPTLEATCILSSGAQGTASVPSGASTGSSEARELRDGDASRYRGLGCRKAARLLGSTVRDGVVHQEIASQADFDNLLLKLDDSPLKAKLGGNTLLAASVAFARAAAGESGQPLHTYFANMIGNKSPRLPRLTINLFSGGKHAGQQVPIQDVLIVPASTNSVDDTLAMAYEVYHAAADLLLERFGMRLLRADEGGMAPPARSEQEMIELALEAVVRSGLKPGSEVFLAIDVASTHFFRDGRYHLKDGTLSSEAMIDRVASWVEQYPLISVEDALQEDDWQHWPALRKKLAGKTLVLGDDFLCTNSARIRRAIDSEACDALLLKANQAGTLSEAADALLLARDAGWSVTISVRSGETEDHWAADLAVGWSGDQFKNGSITQSERLAKYNRLLAVEKEFGFPMNPWPKKQAGSRLR